MSKKSLLVLLFSIDIWASLYILQRQQRHRTTVASWEVTVAMAGEKGSRSVTLLSPVQVWLRGGQCGLWPDPHPVALDELCLRLAAQSRDEAVRLEVRLLCDPHLTLQEWGPVAVRLSEVAEEICVAPLPELLTANPDWRPEHRVTP